MLPQSATVFGDSDSAVIHASKGGFTVRGNQNRSIANREKYMTEVRAAQQEIAARAATDGELARLLADLTRYDKVKHLRVTLQLEQFTTNDAPPFTNCPEVVALEIGDHHQFGPCRG